MFHLNTWLRVFYGCPEVRFGTVILICVSKGPVWLLIAPRAGLKIRAKDSYFVDQLASHGKDASFD